MNQILVTEKVFVTPELKKKRRIFKVNFIISVFLACFLFTYYIYASYDRNSKEQVSKQILANLNMNELDNTTIRVENNVLIVPLDKPLEKEVNVTHLLTSANAQKEIHTSPNGEQYFTESIVNIPRLNINYPVISGMTEETRTTEELLSISLTKFWGPEPNTVGNYCIAGHNYKNKKFFGRLSEIQNGDMVEVTDLNGQTVQYSVYSKYQVDPSDVTCTTQLTDGKREVTLITCTPTGAQRTIVKAREVGK